MSTNQESSGSSELHLAVAAIGQVMSSPGDESQSSINRSVVHRSREDHRIANRRSRSLGPYQSSEVASDLSGLEAGRFELEDDDIWHEGEEPKVHQSQARVKGSSRVQPLLMPGPSSQFKLEYQPN